MFISLFVKATDCLASDSKKTRQVVCRRLEQDLELCLICVMSSIIRLKGSITRTMKMNSQALLYVVVESRL